MQRPWSDGQPDTSGREARFHELHAAGGLASEARVGSNEAREVGRSQSTFIMWRNSGEPCKAKPCRQVNAR